MSGPEHFQFAESYRAQELLEDPVRRHEFFREVLHWEGNFLHVGVGLAESGLTFDGSHILGNGQLRARTSSNPSKEALHLALLGLIVSKEGLPGELLDPGEARRQLEAKAAAFEAYRASYPAHCGFMPWFDAAAGGIPESPELAVRYNGMLAWALYFVAHALEQAGHSALAARFRTHLRVMCASAVRLAYKGSGKVAARVSLAPREQSVVQSSQDCTDPFAGELFCLFLDLLADWGSANERDMIWKDPERRQWLGLGALEARLGASSVRIETMRRSTFSAHEEWKHLFLPYTAVPVCRRLLHAAERARTWWAKSRCLPGLLGDCHIPAPGSEATRHVTDFGIPEVSALDPARGRCDHVAACGGLGLLLAEPATGAVWLQRTLSTNRGMQTPWGMAESCAADGSSACSVLTWDVKATTALAILGGLGRDVRRYLERDGHLSRFTALLEDLYAPHANFGQPLAGEFLNFALPHTEQHLEVQVDSAALGVELQLVGGSRLPPGDARKLFEVRCWFEKHHAEPGAAYCTGHTQEGDPYESWYTSGFGHFHAADEAARRELYGHILACFDLGAPLVLLARQAPLYPLFFDLDLWGGHEGESGSAEHNCIAWEGGVQFLATFIADAVREMYPQFQDGLELAVFSSSGRCRRKRRYKASYHLVFPGVIVDRPVKCSRLEDRTCEEPSPARHVVIRNHLVYRLSVGSEEGQLQQLREDLRRCCNYDVVEASGANTNVSEDPTYLNDWTEVLDENPLWHEPWPEALTGFRLPFTDKPEEGRPKLPFGRWRLTGQPGRLEPLPDLDANEWVRLGDISACQMSYPTPWTEAAIEEAAWGDCCCPTCLANGDV